MLREQCINDHILIGRAHTGGPYTLFAPTNKAFSLISPAELNGILNNPAKLTKLLQRHVVQDLIYTSGLQGFQKAYALDFEILYIYHAKGNWIDSSHCQITHDKFSLNFLSRYDQGERSQRYRSRRNGAERCHPYHRFSFGSLLIEGLAEPPLVTAPQTLPTTRKQHLYYDTPLTQCLSLFFFCSSSHIPLCLLFHELWRTLRVVVRMITIHPLLLLPYQEHIPSSTRNESFTKFWSGRSTSFSWGNKTMLLQLSISLYCPGG